MADAVNPMPGMEVAVNAGMPSAKVEITVQGESLPRGGNPGDVLTKTDGGSTWARNPHADLSENDVNNPAYVKNRTHYAAIEEITITWDGDIDGKETVPFEPPFYKIDDRVFSPSDVIGGTLTVAFDGGTEEITITEDMVEDLSEFIPGAWIVVIEGATLIGSGNAISELGTSGGLYFTLPDNPAVYVSSFTFVRESIHTLDAKYLPDIPAEKLPDIPAEKLPDIPAEKLPDIPAEKLPDIPAEKLPDTFDLVVELDQFSEGNLTNSKQILFYFSNVTYAKLLEAAKKGKLILTSTTKSLSLIPSIINVSSDGHIFVDILIYWNGYLYYIVLTCNPNGKYFYRSNWHKVAMESGS